MELVPVAQAVGIICGALLGLAAVLRPLLKWLVVKPLQASIEQSTYPISPNANGGKSLPDVAKNTQNIQAQLDRIEKRLEKHIDWHLDQ
jgi:hypothetical protein